MKPPSPYCLFRLGISSAVLGTLVMPQACPAAAISWNGSSSGGTWGTTKTNWNTEEVAPWSEGSGPSNRATFDTAGLTLNVTAATTNGITFYQPATLSAGTLTLAGTAPTIEGSGIIRSVVAGNGGFTKTASGDLTLSGANTYSGETLIAGGILKITHSSALGTPAGKTTVDVGGELELTGNNLTVSEPLTLNGGELCGDSSYSHTYEGAITLTADSLLSSDSGQFKVTSVIDGGFGLTKVGTGTLVLAGENTYSGGTILSTGTLAIHNAKALGTGALTISSGTLDNASGAAVTNANNNAQNWNGDFAYVGRNNLDLGTGTVTLGGNRIVNSDYGASTLIVSGVIADGTNDYSLTKTGGGKLALAGANTHSGGTSLNAGTLYLNHAQALGTGALTITGGTLDSNTNEAITITNANNNAQNWNGDFIFHGTKNLNLGAGAVTLGGDRIVTTNYNILTISGIIGDGTNSYRLTKTGAGTLALAGANTFKGGTLLSAGVLAINHAQALSTGALTITGGTLDNSTTGMVTNANNNAQNWNGDFTFHGSKNLDIGTGSVTLGGNRVVTTNYNTLTVGGIIGDGANTYSLTKAGAATLALAGANTYDGETIVQQGKLQISNALALGTTAGSTTVQVAGELELVGSGLTVHEPLTLNGGAICNSANTNTYSGIITLTANSLIDADAGTLSITSAIGETGGSFGLTKVGGGVIVVGAANTYGGGTIVTAGTLTCSGGSALGATTGTLTVSNPNTAGGKAVVLNLSTTAPTTTGSLSGSIATPTSGSNTATIHNGGQLLTVNQTRADTYAGVIAGAGGLTLGASSTNALTLSGINTYDGNTVIAGAKLRVSGSIANSAVSVTSGTLASGAAGTLGKSVTLQSGAILAPGDSATTGTATVTNATTFQNASIFSWDVDSAGTSYDKLISASLMDGDSPGGAVFQIVASETLISNAFWNTTKTWTDIFTTHGSTAITDWAKIFTHVSVVNPSFTEITPASGSFSLSGSTLTWNYTAVPEATPALAGFLLGAGLLRRRRTQAAALAPASAQSLRCCITPLPNSP